MSDAVIAEPLTYREITTRSQVWVLPHLLERGIGIYDSNGNRVGFIPLGSLAFPNIGQKLYSFGALSDVHIGYDTAASDFQTALTYLKEQEKVAFNCICGDLTGAAYDSQFEQYKAIVDTYSTGTPVYAIAGNHEGMTADIENRIATYTGHPLYYSFTHGDDVFIMVGTIGGEQYSNLVLPTTIYKRYYDMGGSKWSYRYCNILYYLGIRVVY